MTRLELKLAQTHVALTGQTRQQVLQLMMTRKENLCIANSECSKYEDLRTREQAEKKLVIDYVITTKRDLNKIKTMEIDEEKEFRICKVKMQNKKQ